MAYAQYFASESQRLGNAAITDTSLPTFAGIVGLVANANGSLTASWAAASGTKPNFRYRIFINTSNVPATLFTGASIPYVSKNSATSVDIFEDGAGALLQNGVTYYVGIRALDSQGFSDTSTTFLSAVSQGVPATSTNNLLNQIIATIGTPVATVATDIAAIKAQTNGISAIPTNPLLTTDSRLNSLANLDVAVSTRAATADSRFANLDTTISSRAATADSRFALLDVAVSSRASQTSINQIQNNTLSVFVVPELLVVPDTGSTSYNFYAYFYNDVGAPIDPDAQHVNVTLKTAGGTTITGPTFMTRSAQGIYSYPTTVSAGASEQTLYVFFDYAVGGTSLEQVRLTEVSLYQNDIDILLGRLTATRAANLDYLDVSVASRAATSDSRFALLDVAVSTRATQTLATAIKAVVDTIPNNPLLTNDTRLLFLDASIAARASQSTLDTYFGNMSALAGNLSTVQTNLTTVQTSLSADVVTLDADIITVADAANTANTAANTAAQAATNLNTGIVQLNNDVGALEDATAKIEQDAQIFATSNLTGAVSEQDALVGVVGT